MTTPEFNTMTRILRSGGLRVPVPEFLRAPVERLVAAGKATFETGPVHGPNGSYYLTAAGCIAYRENETREPRSAKTRAPRTRQPRVCCPDCDAEGRINGRRCVMCSGRGDFALSTWRRMVGDDYCEPI